MNTLKSCVVAAAVVLVTTPVFGADFPNKPIRLIVTAAAGGGEDMEAPPKTPADIVKILEDGFRKAAQEQVFIDIAAKRKMVLEPVSSKEYAKAVEDSYPFIAKFQDMLTK